MDNNAPFKSSIEPLMPIAKQSSERAICRSPIKCDAIWAGQAEHILSNAYSILLTDQGIFRFLSLHSTQRQKWYKKVIKFIDYCLYLKFFDFFVSCLTPG